MKSELIASSFTTHRIESYRAPAFVTALEPSTRKSIFAVIKQTDWERV